VVGRRRRRALLSDPDRASATLAELAGAGVQVSLDDLGRGQTSLGYLSALPVHELKVDKSFVLDMLENPAHAAIVRSIVRPRAQPRAARGGRGVETELSLTAFRETHSVDVFSTSISADPRDPRDA
jgi:predicted signal transduction protein with EAL and GGDEF domain